MNQQVGSDQVLLADLWDRHFLVKTAKLAPPTSNEVRLVGLSGLEPPTSRLSGVRSNRLSYKPISGFRLSPLPTGGDERVRTDDPLLAKQVLSQLSYTPMCKSSKVFYPFYSLLSFFAEPQKLNNDRTDFVIPDLDSENFFSLHVSIERR